MNITITTRLTQRERRALDRFFDRAYDSNDYAATGTRIRKSSVVEVALRDGLEEGYSEVNEAHKLAKRAMIAIGRTFDYEISRMTMVKITEKELKVLFAIRNNDYCNGDATAATWVECINASSTPSGVEGRSLSGVVASLAKKDLVSTNGESIALTSTGLDATKGISDLSPSERK